MNITYILEKRWAIPAAVGVVSLGVGFGTGYILGKRRGFVYGVNATISTFSMPDAESEDPQLSLLDYMEDAGEDILVSKSDAEDFINMIEAEDEEDYRPEHTVSLVVNQKNDPRKIVILGEDPPEDEDEDDDNLVQSVTTNVFTNLQPAWDYDKEALNRLEVGVPYVIHRDEFMMEESGYTQETLTYYQGDDILTDSTDAPVYNFKQIVGKELPFGYGSEDPNIVYVRNDERGMEWEIILHTGRYEIEVLGLELEHEYEKRDLKHSSVPKFHNTEY